MANEKNIKYAPNADLPQQVAEHMTLEIRERRLLPGDKLPPEADLCEQYGVSRTVIREAVSRLKHDGLLESRQGSGVLVAPWENRRTFRLDWINTQDPYNVNFLYEIRVIVGVEAAQLAALRHTGEDLALLNQYMAEMAAAIARGEDGAIPHRGFHKTIAEASHNPYLIEFESYIQDRLWDVFKQARKRTQTTPGLAQKVHKQHQIMLDAIETGSQNLAREAALNHLFSAAKRAGVMIYHKLQH